MDNYIRFQTSMLCPVRGIRLGIFYAAGKLKNEGLLERYDLEQVKKSFAWFNCNLAAPALRGKKVRGVCWFRSSAQELISRAWDIISVLQAADVSVDRHVTKRPGAIVYSDEQQIVAIPHRKPRRIKIDALRV